MNDPRGRGLAERLLGLALAIFVAVWLIVRAVHLIETVLTPLVIVIALGLIVALSVFIIRFRQNRW